MPKSNNVRMMHESILAKLHPYIFFTLQLDSAWESSKVYHKFTGSS